MTLVIHLGLYVSVGSELLIQTYDGLAFGAAFEDGVHVMERERSLYASCHTPSLAT